MQLNSDTLKKTLTFDTWEGIRHKNYRFVAILDAETVMALGFDAPAKHQQNYPYLPAGAPDSYSAYSYAKFMTGDNAIVYLGIPWVKATSIVENNNPTTLIRVKATQAELTSLRSMMIAHGMVDFTFETL